MKPFLFLAFGLFFAPSLMNGEEAAPAPYEAPDKQSDYNKILTHFFAMVKAERYTDAAHILIDTNPQDSYSVEKHEAIAVPLSKMAETFGPFKEFKPLVSKTMGDALGYVYGVGIYDRNVVRFEFLFFKDGDHWRMLHIDFSVNFIDEIRSMAGVHFPTPQVIAAPPAAAKPPEKPKPQDNQSLLPVSGPTPATPSTPVVPVSPSAPDAPSAPVAPTAPSTPSPSPTPNP